jgi:heat shock protein HtpX
MAHEMSHIRNYDIRLMLLMAVLMGTVVMLSHLFWQIVQSGGGRGSKSSSSDSKSDGGGWIVLVVLVLAVVLAMIAPLLAQLIQFAAAVSANTWLTLPPWS